MRMPVDGAACNIPCFGGHATASVRWPAWLLLMTLARAAVSLLMLLLVLCEGQLLLQAVPVCLQLPHVLQKVLNL
jgi:hypothetical protein